jgi:hypothetical protein
MELVCLHEILNPPSRNRCSHRRPCPDCSSDQDNDKRQIRRRILDLAVLFLPEPKRQVYKQEVDRLIEDYQVMIDRLPRSRQDTSALVLTAYLGEGRQNRMGGTMERAACAPRISEMPISGIDVEDRLC